MEITFDAPHHKATWLGETNSAYETGKEYLIHVQKMKCGRFQVFKTLHHFKEESGHKVYNTREEIATKFKFLS